MKLFYSLLTCILSLTVFTVSAEETDTEAELDRYRIELILFSQTPVQGDDEMWLENDRFPLLAEAQPLTLDSSTMPLSRDTAEMGAILYTLQQSALYRPLLHTVWEQPGWSADEAQAVRIEIPFDAELPQTVFSENAPLTDTMTVTPLWQSLPGIDTSPKVDNRLSGTIKISRARYLHAEFDLLYREIDSSQTRLVNESINGAFGEVMAGPQTIDIPLQQKRRMRSKEIHYIDHPRLGALILITPVEVEEESEQVTEEPAVSAPEPN